MTTTATDQGVRVPLRQVEQELGRQMRELQGALTPRPSPSGRGERGEGAAETPIRRACMSNLLIYCDSADQVAEVAEQVPEIAATHPARVLLLAAEPGKDADAQCPPTGVEATVLVRRLQSGRNHRSFSEQVTLHASGGAVGKLPFAVRALLIGDLPINLWWRSQQPPPHAGPLLYELADNAQQIIYDSRGWLEPARAVAGTASWLEQFEQSLRGGRWRVASDLNWRRLKYWRRAVSQALDASAAPGAINTATDLLVEHGPHAVVQAWELVSWLTSLLGWEVHAGDIEHGQEISWQFHAPHGLVHVRIQRLPEGPPEVLMVRLQCSLAGTPGAVLIRLEDSRRLVVSLEGTSAVPLTVLIQPQSTAELVGRQLSDRERDPVFEQSMAVAQTLAKSIVG